MSWLAGAGTLFFGKRMGQLALIGVLVIGLDSGGRPSAVSNARHNRTWGDWRSGKVRVMMRKTMPMRLAGLAMLLALTVSGYAQALGLGSTEAVKPCVLVRVIDNSLKNFDTFRPSPRDTCGSQRAMFEHNSVYDTLKMRKQGNLKKGEVIA